MPRRDQIPDGKRQLNIILSKSLYEQLVRIAPEYYGKGRGGISRLVEDALKQYIPLLMVHTQKHNGGGKVFAVNPRLSVREEYNQFIRTFKRVWLETHGTSELPIAVRFKLIDSIIIRAFERAKDERTRLRKLHNWFLAGLVKPLYPEGFRPSKPRDWRKVTAIELVSRGEA